MSDKYFWWNWSVNLGVAIGTLAVALVALFGDWIRAKLFSPKLKIRLKNPTGNKTPVRFTEQTEEGLKERIQSSRYYHIEVSNDVPWPRGTDVQILLVRTEEFGPDGDLQVRWTGDIPLIWRHQEIYPLGRIIGPPADCDFFSVIRGTGLTLALKIFPNNLIAHWPGKLNIIASLQVKSNEGLSPIFKYQISWDGNWVDGEKEMSQHLIVKEFT